MDDDDPFEPREWVQLDVYGRVTGPAFHGDFAALRTHLLRDLPDGTVPEPRTSPVYVRPLAATVTCPLVTLRTPWGSTRWIPRQASRAEPSVPSWLQRR